jgi:hypothetical protein
MMLGKNSSKLLNQHAGSPSAVNVEYGKVSVAYYELC